MTSKSKVDAMINGRKRKVLNVILWILAILGVILIASQTGGNADRDEYRENRVESRW